MSTILDVCMVKNTKIGIMWYAPFPCINYDFGKIWIVIELFAKLPTLLPCIISSVSNMFIMKRMAANTVSCGTPESSSYTFNIFTYANHMYFIFQNLFYLIALVIIFTLRALYLYNYVSFSKYNIMNNHIEVYCKV